MQQVIRLVGGRSASLALALALALLPGLSACGTTPNRTPAGLAERPALRSEEVPETTRGGPAPAEVVQASGAAAGGAVSDPPRAVAPLENRVDTTIAYVAGQPVAASELLARWLHRESPKVRTYLEELVLERVVIAEARRLGVTLDRTKLDEAVEQSMTQIEAEIARGQTGLSIDEFLLRKLGLDPETYRARVRRDRELDLLAARCVRTWLLASERAEVRVIVNEDRAKIEEIQEHLKAGSDFAALASEHSIENAENGGRIPPVVRGNAALARLAFSTPVGQIGGPVLEAGRYLLIRVDARPAIVAGAWSEVGSTVEASLRERDVEDPEYWQWKAAMLETYEVDMTPFLGLVGEPEQ